ncbi:shikimate and dehydroshikimate transport protein [Klebsiella pneumoniae]|nr:shikimate and dehydroshikimate transport protein [Klebsiella pneumoniae]
MLATIVAFGILWAPVTAVLGTLCSEIFSANVRYTGITLGYQLGAALAGGTAPLIATGLLAKYDGDWRPVAIYLGVYGGDFAPGDILRQPDEVRAEHGPLPGGKRLTAARQGYYGADYPARRRCACAAWGDRAAGETAYPRSGKHVGPVRRQPSPGRNRRQVFPPA